MRFRFRRISVRSALIVIAVLAVLLGTVRWYQERQRVWMYREFEKTCDGLEKFYRQTALEARAAGNTGRAVTCEKAADQNARLKSRFARAALNPWGPPPDPSKP